MTDDEHFMGLALEAARAAAESGETPVGCVIVNASGQIVATAGNAPMGRKDPTAHAEVLALRAAGAALGNYRLCEGLTLYVSLEPCTMCAGAISFARIARLVYGASDPKGGAAESGVRFFDQPTCHWRPDVQSGVRAAESAEMLKAFFRARR